MKHLLAGHGGKAGEELVNGLAASEVIHKILQRHPRSGEEVRAAGPALRRHGGQVRSG